MHNSIKPLNFTFNYITFNSQEAAGRQDLKSYGRDYIDGYRCLYWNSPSSKRDWRL